MPASESLAALRMFGMREAGVLNQTTLPRTHAGWCSVRGKGDRGHVISGGQGLSEQITPMLSGAALSGLTR